MTNKIVILQNSVELYEHYINDEKWERTLSFKRGGLTYLISNGTIKFYAYVDYFYRNCLMSMPLPLYIVDEKRGIDGEYSDIDEITELLDPIFPSNDIDAELAYYLTIVEAAETYQPKGNYLTKASADTLYQPIGDYVTDEELVEALDDYYTKDECDERFQPIGDYLTSADTYTREEIDDKLDDKLDASAYTPVDLSDYYTKEQVDERITHYSAGTGIDITDGVISCTVTGGSSGCGCDLSDYVTYEDMAEYVGDIYTKEEVNNLFVTKQYFSSNTISRDVFITTIYNLNQEINSLKAAISACCGSTGETYTRWITVPNEFTCSGTTKYSVEKEQTSTDNINWTDTGNTRRGSVLEYNSVDCGYVPVSTYKVEMRYNDGTEDNRQCDGSGLLRWLNPSNWENISGITVGDCIDELGATVFQGFSGATDVYLPNTVTKIGKYAFGLCVSLPSINIPSGVTYIGQGAFDRCSSLTSIVIPNGVTNLEYATFAQCRSLTSVTLSNSLVSIDGDVFDNCSFSSITIPATVETIGQYAFSFNRNLDTVICLATTPPTLENDNVFYGSDRLTKILVPAQSVQLYKSSWGTTYADLIYPIS